MTLKPIFQRWRGDQMSDKHGKRPPGHSPAGAKKIGFDIRRYKTEARYTAARVSRQATNDNGLEADLWRKAQDAANALDDAAEPLAARIAFDATWLAWEREFVGEHP